MLGLPYVVMRSQAAIRSTSNQAQHIQQPTYQQPKANNQTQPLHLRHRNAIME
jgi:hypothetical protein